MYKIIFGILFFCQIFAYDIGDIISDEHQALEFSYCYPSDSTSSTFSFSKHEGKVILLDMSTSW